MYDLNDDDAKGLRTVLTRASVDREFRARLLADPRSAIKDATGTDVPAGFRIQFVEQPREVDAYVVLPHIVEESAELSDEELEAVAGGLCWGTCDTTCGGTCDITCLVSGVEVPVVA